MYQEDIPFAEHSATQVMCNNIITSPLFISLCHRSQHNSDTTSLGEIARPLVLCLLFPDVGAVADYHSWEDAEGGCGEFTPFGWHCQQWLEHWHFWWRKWDGQSSPGALCLVSSVRPSATILVGDLEIWDKLNVCVNQGGQIMEAAQEFCPQLEEILS